MFHFVLLNLPTLLVGGLVLGLLIGVIIKMIKDKKKGKSACGCNCAGCFGADICHKQ